MAKVPAGGSRRRADSVLAGHQFDAPWTQVPNHLLRSDTLSPLAKALWSEMASHRPGWRFSATLLARPGVHGYGRRPVMDALNELIEAGWLERSERTMDGFEYRLQVPEPADAQVAPMVPKQHHRESRNGTVDGPETAPSMVPNRDHEVEDQREDQGEEDPAPVGAAPAPESPAARAREVVDAWWDWHKRGHDDAPPTTQPYIAVVKVVERLFGAGWSRLEVAGALRDVPGGVVSAATMQLARANAQRRPAAAAATGRPDNSWMKRTVEAPDWTTS